MLRLCKRRLAAAVNRVCLHPSAPRVLVHTFLLHVQGVRALYLNLRKRFGSMDPDDARAGL